MYTCPKHGGVSVERNGQFGVFYGCPTYAETKCKEKQVIAAGSDVEYDEPEIPEEPSKAKQLADSVRTAVSHFNKPYKKDEDVDWEAINRGKVRCQVAVAFIGLRKEGQEVRLNQEVEQVMERWVDYIMDGPSKE